MPGTFVHNSSEDSKEGEINVRGSIVKKEKKSVTKARNRNN